MRRTFQPICNHQDFWIPRQLLKLGPLGSPELTSCTTWIGGIPHLSAYIQLMPTKWFAISLGFSNPIYLQGTALLTAKWDWWSHTTEGQSCPPPQAKLWTFHPIPHVRKKSWWIQPGTSLQFCPMSTCLDHLHWKMGGPITADIILILFLLRVLCRCGGCHAAGRCAGTVYRMVISLLHIRWVIWHEDLCD